jgi:hypothetical protein
MNILKSPMRRALALAFALVAVSCATVMAETVKKIHSAPQLIMNLTKFNDTNESNSSTVDLAGGDLDEVSFAVNVSSSDGSALLNLAVQISPDGGTTWISTGDSIDVSTGATATASSTEYLANKTTQPGTKMRLLATLTGNTTYQNLKVWAMPAAN